jgi:hypothetical protein
MRVIFLDIDGVMNSNIFYEERYKRRWFKRRIKWPLRNVLTKIKLLKQITSDNYKTPKNYYTFDYQFKWLIEETCEKKWKWLSDFCNQHDIKICISSVWKNHFGDKNGRQPELWEDALVRLGFKPGTFVGITNTHKTLRGDEIKDWLDMNPQVIDYAILDDDSDMLPEQLSKYHQCDSWFGMSPNHIYRIGWQFNLNKF